jgi:hypothetical protein
MLRVVLGVLAAPLAAAPVIALIFGAWSLANGGVATLASIVLQTLAVAYPATVLFGLPVHLALVRQGYRRATHYATAGALLGALPVIAYTVVAIAFEAKFALSAMGRAAGRNLEWGAIGVLVFGAVTAAVAAAFWWVAVRTANATASPS